MLKSLFQHFSSLVIVDVETTGLYAKTDEIIELAALKVVQRGNSYCTEDELDTLIQLTANRKLSNKVVELTGITEQMLHENGKPKIDVCMNLVEFLCHPNTLVAAYNAHFDLSFLYYFLKSHDSAHVLRQVKMLDAMTVYKDRRDYPHKLSDAVSAYKLDNQKSHRALDDARATLALLVAMEIERDDLGQYVNLFGYNPRYGVSGSRIASVTYLPQGFDRHKRLYEN